MKKIFFILLLIIPLPLINIFSYLHWHDQQRLGQILIFFLIFIFFIKEKISKNLVIIKCSEKIKKVFFLIISLGILSTLFSEKILFAATEFALILSLLGLGYWIATNNYKFKTEFSKSIVAALLIICIALFLKFFISYITAITSDLAILDSWMLLDGFTNPRFYGQFLTLALPILLIPYLLINIKKQWKFLGWSITALVWMLAIVSGTRGTWLGLGLTVITTLCLGNLARRWAIGQITAASFGILLFYILMTLIPNLLDIKVSHHAAERLTGSLSGRELIWSLAWHAALEHPLLGMGPMHFAAIPNPVAAHPHQAFLQWAAEWGIPSALMLTWLIFYGLYSTGKIIYRQKDSAQPDDIFRLSAAASVFAALVQSMVDGVIVMPYIQLWLALISGWLLGLHPSVTMIKEIPNYISKFYIFILSISTVILIFMVIENFPNNKKLEKELLQTQGSSLQPRFWTQGVIKFTNKRDLTND